MSTNTPAGITAEGTFTPDKLHAGDHPVRTVGLTLKATTVALARGTLVYLKNGETEYEPYDGGTVTTGSLMGILVDDVAINQAAQSVAVYIAGDFNSNGITVATGGTLATVRGRLALQSLYVIDAVAA